MANRVPYEKKKMNLPFICVYDYHITLINELAKQEDKKPSCILQEFIRAYFAKA